MDRETLIPRGERKRREEQAQKPEKKESKPKAEVKEDGKDI